MYKINCNRWFRSKGELSVHTCRPEGHAYFVSSFVPKFWGCVINLAAIQQDRIGVCAYICMSGRESASFSLVVHNKSSLYVCVCVCVHVHAQSSLLLLCSISVES